MKAVYKVSEGTTAALNIELGLKADHVKVINLVTFDFIEAWFVRGVLVVCTYMNADDGVVIEDADGIALYSGAVGTAASGITLAADAVVNANGNALHVIAETYTGSAGGAAESTSAL